MTKALRFLSYSTNDEERTPRVSACFVTLVPDEVIVISHSSSALFCIAYTAVTFIEL